MDNLRDLLSISPEKLGSINAVLADPESEIMKRFLDIVARYGTPSEINRKHIESRSLPALLRKVEERNPSYLQDLHWLIEQRDAGAFVTVDDYVRDTLLKDYSPSWLRTDKPVTLEVSALQYFPWIRPMCERAIRSRTLVPGRFIAVRKMKESEADGDLPAIVAALDVMGASFVETLDTKGTDGSNPHLGGPATITGYFGGIGQPNEHALQWVDEFLYYYTNYGVQHVLNFNAGTILLGFLLYRLGIDIKFKVSVFFGSDNPYHAFWILMMAKLLSRDDNSSPLIGFNWSNSTDNETIELTAQFRKSLGFENVVRFEHHITETWKSIVIQPYNRREELLDLAERVANISAKHEGADPEIESASEHPSDILDYFRDKDEVLRSGEWDYLQQNFLGKVDSSNKTARSLVRRGLPFIAAPNLHR